MPNELETLSKTQINALVATTPTENRAALSKALEKVCRHVLAAKKDYAKAYEVASAMVENWWHLGCEIPKLGITTGPKRINDKSHQLKLSDIGVTPKQSERCQKLARHSKDELTEWLDSKYSEECKYLPTLGAGSEQVGNRAVLNTGEDSWYTPKEWIDAAKSVMGELELDPASCEKANATVEAKTFYDAATDGLEQEWHGTVWMNPPYKQPLVWQFVDKLCSEYEVGRVNQAICLVNNATDTEFFHRAANACSRIAFTNGRIAFYNNTQDKSSPTQGQAFFYFGKRVNEFKDVFSERGCFVCVGV